MKLAVVGKGGVGKTFISGTLARFFAEEFEVLAVDNDPSMNLIYSLGMDPELRKKITPISSMTRLIKERTSLGDDVPGIGDGIYNANPKVSDIPDRYKLHGPDNLQLLVLGTIENPSTGCLCPGNVLIRTLLYELILKRKEVVIIDFEAGLEHLGRGTAKGIDTMLIITAAYRKSLDLSEKVLNLANKMGIKKIYLIGNMISNKKSEQLVQNWAKEHGIDILGMIPLDENIANCELEGLAPFDSVRYDSKALKKIKDIYRKLKEYYVNCA
ncbi:MAG: nucleotide-binding protein [Promethearchaeota archaeon]